MLDAPDMFPKGWHAERQSILPDFSGLVRARRRKFTRGIKYRFIDFGISRAFESYEARKKVIGSACQDKTVPEFQTGEFYDPFKLDIYTLGNVFKKRLIEACPLYLAVILTFL